MKTDALDWQKIAEEIDSRGFSRLEGLLDKAQCRALIEEFGADDLYRRHIVMQQHGYGQGEYKYFAYPLPELVAGLRSSFYESLAPIANRWAEQLKTGVHYPSNLEDYTKICHASGQLKPTPLILKYAAGDYNRLHQDLYGDHLFPLQMAVLLSDPAREFDGGEFILTEQRPRQQSRATVVPLKQGDAVIFAVNERPIEGKVRFVRVKMRHGVSDVRSGHRYTLGVIFHDAK